MTVASGVYPYRYIPPYPLRVKENENFSGILNTEDPYTGRSLFTLPAISGISLGNAWHSLLAQIRLFNRFNVVPTIKAYINDAYNVVRNIREPDASGFAFTAEQRTEEFNFTQVPNIRLPSDATSGVAQIHTSGYIKDLRVGLDSLFTSMASEYNDFSLNIRTGAQVNWDKDFLLRDWLRAMFRDTVSGVIGEYNYPLEALATSGAMFDVSWAEVFYNPYPRIASKEAMNVSNNIRDQRFDTASQSEENNRIYARLSQFGPIYPPFQTPEGFTLIPTDIDQAIITDSSNFVISLSGWAHAKNNRTIRVDGHILVSGLVDLKVIENINRKTAPNNLALIDDELYNVLGTSIDIYQSGAREFGRTVNKRTPNVGINIYRFPATSIGYPSHSGEPVRNIAGGIPLLPTQSIINADHSSRAWYGIPVLDNFDYITPRFGEVRNVKRLAVVANNRIAGTINASGVLRDGIAPSGLISIWPSPGAYNGGSGQGHHILDKAIWMRHIQDSQGMVLISPYNGQRIGYKFADVNPVIIEQDVLREYDRDIFFDAASRLATVFPQFQTYTYGVSWGGAAGITAATSFGAHSDGFYHIFGTRTPTSPAPLDEANIVGSISVDNGSVNLVTDFSTFVFESYDAGQTQITHFSDLKAHGLWGIPSLEVIGTGKATLVGDSTNFTTDVQSAFPSFNPRFQNGNLFNILVGIGPATGRIPVGYSVPHYYTMLSWSPGLGLTERTDGGVMCGRGTQTPGTFGYLDSGGFPPLTREDLWTRATTPDEGGFEFGLGTQITPGTHPVATASTLGGIIAQAIDYIVPETQVMTFTAGDIEPIVSVEAIASDTIGTIIQNNFTLGTFVGSLGSLIVGSIQSDFDGKHFGNSAIGGSERQVTGFTYIDGEIIAVARGNNSSSAFADQLSIAPLDLNAVQTLFEETRLNSQNLDPGANFRYIGEAGGDPDAVFWPQIVFADII